MSGIEVFNLIATIIGLTNTIIEVYDGIRDLHGLPEAFEEVNRRLPLMNNTLQHAKGRARDIDSPNEAKALLDLLRSCEEKSRELSEILMKISSKSKGHFAKKAYKSIVTKLGKKRRVEALMEGILRDLSVLAAHRAFEGATQMQVEELAEACESLSKVSPSLPDEEVSDMCGRVSQQGDRNRQYNNFNGKQSNVGGNYFEARNSQYIGRTPIKAPAKNSASRIYVSSDDFDSN